MTTAAGVGAVRRGLAAACVCAAVAVGCRDGAEPPRESPPDADASTGPRRDAALPDLSGADRGLRERIEAAQASLDGLRQREDAAAADVAAAYGQVGKLLIAAEFLSNAEPYLLNARALAPSEMAWPYYLGHVARLRGRTEQALDFFEAALAIRPDYAPALVWAGVLHLDAGRRTEAVDRLQRAVATGPSSAAARLALGRAALAAGDYGGARAHLEAALAAAPAEPRVHYPLAMAYRGLGDETRAAAHLQQWTRTTSPSDSLSGSHLPPDDPLMEEIGGALQTAVALETRGTKALDSGDWTGAAALFRSALQIAPRDATLHQNLGTALYLGGDATAALASFEEAVRLSPGYARAHYSLGVLMEASGRDAEAVRRFGDAVRHDAHMTEARFSLAEALRRIGAVEASLPHYDAVVAADPNASQARFARAMAQVRLGRYMDARRGLEEAVALHPDQPGLPHALARVLAAAPEDGARDGDRALELAQRLFAEHGANATLLETLAMALAETGRFADAAARQRLAIAAAASQGRNDLLPALRDNLRRYETGLPCRTPWADTDPVHYPRPSGVALR